MNFKLHWHENHDDAGNSYWEAAAPYSSDGESVDIHWRIRQKIESNIIIWYADHDAELLPPSSGDETEWEFLSNAQRAIEGQDARLRKSILEENYCPVFDDTNIHVLVAERDTESAHPYSFPIVFETKADNASIETIKVWQKSIGNKFGRTRIARLVWVDPTSEEKQ